jgi:hypothetical protein
LKNSDTMPTKIPPSAIRNRMPSNGNMRVRLTMRIWFPGEVLISGTMPDKTPSGNPQSRCVISTGYAVFFNVIGVLSGFGLSSSVAGGAPRESTGLRTPGPPRFRTWAQLAQPVSAESNPPYPRSWNSVKLSERTSEQDKMLDMPGANFLHCAPVVIR